LVDQISRALTAVGAPPLTKKELTATRPKFRDVAPTGPQNETALPPPKYSSPQARKREMGQVLDEQKMEIIEEILGLANIDFIRGTPTEEQKAALAEQLKNYERAQGRDSEFYKIVLKRYKEYYGKHGMGKSRKCPKCGLSK
jgi:phenylpyruvate tautomerase PptA (4-oxalocrotonate tautomerase family)